MKRLNSLLSALAKSVSEVLDKREGFHCHCPHSSKSITNQCFYRFLWWLLENSADFAEIRWLCKTVRIPIWTPYLYQWFEPDEPTCTRLEKDDMERTGCIIGLTFNLTNWRQNKDGWLLIRGSLSRRINVTAINIVRCVWSSILRSWLTFLHNFPLKFFILKVGCLLKRVLDLWKETCHELKWKETFNHFCGYR